MKKIVLKAKVCTNCKKSKSRTDFFVDNHLKSGLTSACKECRKARADKYYWKNYLKRRAKQNEYAEWYFKTDHGRKVSREVGRCMFIKHREQYRAVAKLNNAIRAGKIIRGNCEVCGEANAQAHHYNGYDGDNWSKVKWLCIKHHKEEHYAPYRDAKLQEAL